MDTAVFADRRADATVVDNWLAMPSWWGNPVADPLDRATAYLPQLMSERLGELGIDFMLTYPSWTLGLLDTRDDALRGPVCRATNRYIANLFAGHRDRFEPAALIPMQTPDEAVAEINFAAQELGFKSVVLHGFAKRAVGSGSSRLDFFGRRQPVRLRPGVGRLRGEQIGSRLPQLLAEPPSRPFDHQLRQQPRQRDRQRPSGALQIPVPRRGLPALPRTAGRLSRRRDRLGRGVAGRSDRPLGQAGRRTPSVASIRPSSTWRPCW